MREKGNETSMDNTVKEYEHRRLVCEHECKVGEKYILPQAQAFGLSWSNAKGSLADIRSCNWGRTEMQQPLPPELQPGGGLPPLFSRTHLPIPWL